MFALFKREECNAREKHVIERRRDTLVLWYRKAVTIVNVEDEES